MQILSYTSQRLMFILSLILLSIHFPSCQRSQNNKVEDESTKIEKVKNAMLAMQRRAWEQGVAAQAMLEMGETEWLILLTKDAVVNQLEDGRLGVNEGNRLPVTDPAANGEPLMHAALVTGDTAMESAAYRMLDYLLNQAPSNPDGILYHHRTNRRIWVDALYMAPPFLSFMGYHEEALKQIKGYREILQDTVTGMYYHIWDDAIQDFRIKKLWGVGNGWAAAGIARVIHTLPVEMKKEKELLAGYAKEIIDGCLPFLRDDGLFHNIMDDSSTFIETNAGQMISYTIFRGVNEGWLDATYIPYASRMRKAAHGKVDSFGLVQGVCGAPFFDQPGTATEGQAFFLLMENAFKAYIK
jgi:unsaturated rhamnogalacturonyl hydrolase